jgi:hypothetical protein
VPKRLWVAGVLCAAAPDLDVLGFAFGVPYGDLLGHRGLSHSIPFAAVATAPIAFVVARRVWRRAWLYLFLATASHGLLDACTNGSVLLAAGLVWCRRAWRRKWPADSRFVGLEAGPTRRRSYWGAVDGALVDDDPDELVKVLAHVLARPSDASGR